MNWQKKGFIYWATGSKPWSALYAMMPTPVLPLDESSIRVYIGVTSIDKFGSTISIDVDSNDPSKVLVIHDGPPVLGLGEPGNFDDSGAVPSSVLVKDGIEYCITSGFINSDQFEISKAI